MTFCIMVVKRCVSKQVIIVKIKYNYFCFIYVAKKQREFHDVDHFYDRLWNAWLQAVKGSVQIVYIFTSLNINPSSNPFLEGRYTPDTPTPLNSATVFETGR